MGREHTLRILHISDLHARGSREPAPWRRRRVLGTAWEQNLDALRDDGPFDLLCMTGDLAFSGHPTEYAEVTDFLMAVLDHLSMPRGRLFMVPGNHDVHRDTEVDAWRELRGHMNHHDAEAFSQWLAGGRAPRGIGDGLRDAVLRRQAAYRNWLEHTLHRGELLPARSPHQRLGYRATLRLPDQPFDIHVLGLDSAWLAGDAADSRHLWLTEDQVMRLATDDRGNPLPGFRLALIHHPLTDLADGEHCRRLLAGSAAGTRPLVDLLLRGHLHETEPETWADPERTLHQLAAGCLYESDRYPNACIASTVTLDDTGRPLRYELRFRGWSKRGHWFDDNSLYPDTSDGRLAWFMDTPSKAETTPQRGEIIDLMEALKASLGASPEHAPETREPAQGTKQRLEDALKRKQKLEAARLPTGSVLAEIRELKRELRRGGQLRSGDVLGDRYLLGEQIGRGGFATVWRARDSATDEDVAIKVLHSELAGDVIRRQRFFRGARIMAELAHPLVVRILEREAEDDGFFYFVMSFIAGGNLQDAVLEQRVTCEQVVPIILSVGEALAEAHARGHVHRDIKPMNILLTESGEPRLTDFDLVTAHDTTGGTRTGALGTFMFAAPEMMERPQDADARADVYGLGMTMVFMLHGSRLPMKALTARERFLKDLGCTSVLEAALKQATSAEPDERYPNIAAFCEALRAATSPGSPRGEKARREDIKQSLPRKRTRAPVLPLAMVGLPGGRFWMGSADDDEMADETEKPRRQVEVLPFWCMKYPVTRRLWRTITGEDNDWWPEGSHDDRPANNVSWFDAVRFCNALSELSRLTPCYRIEDETVEWVSSQGYRLPTEAEWEYACRAGSQGHWCCGDDERELGEYAWYAPNADAPQPVGRKKPNAWGLHDMHGNVWEWSWDWDATYPKWPSRTPLVDPRGPRQGSLRILRGGSFAYKASQIRCADRLANWPADRGKNWGFRCVRGSAAAAWAATPSPKSGLAKISNKEIRNVLREHSWDVKVAADALGIARNTLYERIWASEIMRDAESIGIDELRKAYDECAGDLDVLVLRLGISKATLKLRMKKLGFP